MTRINLVPPSELSTKHLIAEYRELPRVFGLVSKRLKKLQDFEDIPPLYTMGAGHVKFFYDKLGFLRKRFQDLVEEMLSRGYTVRHLTLPSKDQYPEHLRKDYEPTPEAISINRARIAERTKK